MLSVDTATVSVYTEMKNHYLKVKKLHEDTTYDIAQTLFDKYKDKPFDDDTIEDFSSTQTNLVITTKYIQIHKLYEKAKQLLLDTAFAILCNRFPNDIFILAFCFNKDKAKIYDYEDKLIDLCLKIGE